MKVCFCIIILQKECTWILVSSYPSGWIGVGWGWWKYSTVNYITYLCSSTCTIVKLLRFDSVVSVGSDACDDDVNDDDDGNADDNYEKILISNMSCIKIWGPSHFDSAFVVRGIV